MLTKCSERIFQWRWFLLSLSIIGIFTERSLKSVRDDYQLLEEQLKSLKIQKELSIQKQELLKRNINSQSDPTWIELVLKRELGLTPEGQNKILFVPNDK